LNDENIALYYSSGFYRDTLGISVEDMDADELRRAQDVADWLWTRNITPKSHADIGASRGYLLEKVGAGEQNGYDVNPKYGEYDKVKFATYELVTAIHLLEHVTDPKAELKWYKSLSSDKVLIEVPSEKSQGGPLRFAHLFYFPADLLVSMVEAAGMTVIELVREPHTRILAKVR
jgi:hypothetical protein